MNDTRHGILETSEGLPRISAAVAAFSFPWSNPWV